MSDVPAVEGGAVGESACQGVASAEALVGLAAVARELSEAVVFATVDDGEAEALRRQIAVLTARLRPDRTGRRLPGLTRRDRVVVNPIGPVAGMMNPSSLPVSITVLPDGGVRAEFRLDAMYAGVPDRVHGGILALILDHLIGVAAVARDFYGATATLDIRYRRPAPHGAVFAGQAELTDVRGRLGTGRAKILADDGHTVADAHALLVRLP